MLPFPGDALFTRTGSLMSIKKPLKDSVASPIPGPLGVGRFTFADLQELSKQNDFCAFLTAAGVPDGPIPKPASRGWSVEEEFDAAKFDDAAYTEYERDFFKK